jgi:hypothetical protein
MKRFSTKAPTMTKVLPNVLLATLIAAMTALTTVGLLAPTYLTAQDADGTPPAEIETPTVEIDRCVISAAFVNKDLAPGDKPQLRLTIYNPTDADIDLDVVPTVTAQDQAAMFSRSMSLPTPVSLAPVQLVVPAGETVEHVVTVHFELLPGSIITASVVPMTDEMRLVAQFTQTNPGANTDASETPNTEDTDDENPDADATIAVAGNPLPMTDYDAETTESSPALVSYEKLFSPSVVLDSLTMPLPEPEPPTPEEALDRANSLAILHGAAGVLEQNGCTIFAYFVDQDLAAGDELQIQFTVINPTDQDVELNVAYDIVQETQWHRENPGAFLRPSAPEPMHFSIPTGGTVEQVVVGGDVLAGADVTLTLGLFPDEIEVVEFTVPAEEAPSETTQE